jgi:biotin carboxylase
MFLEALDIMFIQAQSSNPSHGIATSVSAASLLQGRRFLIVMGSLPGKFFVYERMQALGIKMVILDGAGHWSQPYVEKGLFEGFIEMDANMDTLNRDFDAILAKIRAYPGTFDAVITFHEFATRLTARLAKALGCNGHPYSAVNLDKFDVRERCQHAGLPSPRFALINAAADLEQAAAVVGFPAVLKPVKGGGSCDVFRVTSMDDLLTKYHRIVEQREPTLVETGFNSGLTDVGQHVWQHGFTMVLEEYLEGDEYDIDCLLSYGTLVYASVTEEKPQPDMIETGARLPATCPPPQEAQLIQMAQDTLKALGYIDGLFHVEAKYTANGPRLIEVNPRLGGGPIHHMNRLVWGVDLIEQYLLTALRVPIHPIKRDPQTYLSSQIIVAPYSGRVTQADFLAHLKYDPDVVFCKTYVEAGEWVDGPEQCVPGWLGEIMVKGESREAADCRLEEIVGHLLIPLEPASSPLLV